METNIKDIIKISGNVVEIVCGRCKTQTIMTFDKNKVLCPVCDRVITIK